MAPTRLRRLLVVPIVLAVAALAAAAGGAGGSSPATEAAGTQAASYAMDAQATASPQAARLVQAAADWRGGPITTSTGEVVRVFVSDALPLETTPEAWAEFLVRLTHGPELALVTLYVAPLAEVQEICGSRALGCYTRNRMVAYGEPTIGETTAEEVVRHEYGHHVAFHRENAPWAAIDWGPKQWASAADVCARVQRREAFPGDGGRNYAQNPGEAWAETYRLMDERKAGIATATWRIIAPSFFPGESALQAAERDVTEPWTATTTASYQRVFGKRTARVWWIPLATPLDGELRVTAALPRGATHEVALVAPNRRTVLKRGQWVGQRSKRLSATVCGQRGLFLRVTQSGALGRVAITATTP